MSLGVAAITFLIPQRHRVSGCWDREAVDFDGAIPPNHALSVDGDAEVSHQIVSFKKDPEEYFADWEAAGILGTLGYWTDFESGIVSGAVISGG